VNLTWDANGTAAGTGGAGTWDATTQSRFSNSAGTTFLHWVNTTTGNDHTAVFGGAAGAVTVSGGVTASGLQFDVDGYTLGSSTITLAGSTPTIQVATIGHNATISSTLAGSTGMTKTGAGTLALDGTNSFTGTTTLSGGTLALNTGKSLSQSGSTVTVAINGNNTTLTNAGTISQTGSGRAIDVGTANLNITVNNSGSINTVSTDAFRVNADSAVSLTNSGTIAVSAGGQAIDWAAIVTKTNSLINQSAGIISAAGEDAVRPGQNGTITNAGSIIATPTVSSGTASGSDGIDLRTQKTVTVTNSGTISGRHGIATDGANVGPSSLTVHNSAGTIEAVNGSGINVDGVNTNVIANVTNAFGATIRGGVLAATTTGDGDGIDVDGVLTLNNSGDVLGLGAKGGTNNAEGIAAGGGSITNTATGKIIGSTLLADAPNGDSSKAGNGILIDDSNSGNAVASTTVTNSGLIQGKTGFGIKLIGNLADTITNDAGGTIRGAGTGATLQTGGGGDTVTNRGAITSDIGNAIDLEAGDDLLQIEGGAASIDGDISGGAGTNTLTLNPGTGNAFSYTGTISNFDSVKVQSGTVTFSGTNTYAGSTLIQHGTLSAAATNALGGTSGITVNTGGTLLLSGAGTDRINDSATVTLAGGTIAFGGDVTEGSSPGTGALTLSANSIIDFGDGNDVINFNASHLASWSVGTTLSIYNWGGLTAGGGNDQLRFGSDNTALNSAQLDQISFYSGAGTGFLGTGAFVGSLGEVVPVPEPSAVLVALGMFGLAGWRESRRSRARIRSGRRPAPIGVRS
jgi:autotransporter-associated beta strand protein